MSSCTTFLGIIPSSLHNLFLFIAWEESLTWVALFHWKTVSVHTWPSLFSAPSYQSKYDFPWTVTFKKWSWRMISFLEFQHHRNQKGGAQFVLLSKHSQTNSLELFLAHVWNLWCMFSNVYFLHVLRLSSFDESIFQTSLFIGSVWNLFAVWTQKKRHISQLLLTKICLEIKV